MGILICIYHFSSFKNKYDKILDCGVIHPSNAELNKEDSEYVSNIMSENFQLCNDTKIIENSPENKKRCGCIYKSHKNNQTYLNNQGPILNKKCTSKKEIFKSVNNCKNENKSNDNFENIIKGILERHLDIKHLLQISQDVEIIKRL